LYFFFNCTIDTAAE